MTSGAAPNTHAQNPSSPPVSGVPTKPREAAAPPSSGTLLAIALLILAGFVAYRHSFAVPFQFDDIDCIVNNPALTQIFPSGNLVSRLGEKRVVGHVSFALNRRVNGLHLFGYHAVNLAVHLLAGLCLFGIVRRTLALPRYATHFQQHATALAFAVALIWLVHPLQTQAVTYIVQRLESLMGLFYLATLYCVLRGAQARVAWPWNAAACATLWLGMATKEPMVTAPLAVILYDRVFLATSWTQLLKQRGWMYAVFIGAIVWLFWGVSSTWLATAPAPAPATAPPGSSAPPPVGVSRLPSGFGISGLSSTQYLFVQTHVIPHYLQLAVWPAQLCFDYRGYFTVPSVAEAALPGIFLLTLLGASLAAFFWRADVGFIGLFFFLYLGPSSSFYPIIDVAFEHRMYLALIPVVVFAVFGVYLLGRRWLKDPQARNFVYCGLLILVAGGCIWRTSLRNLDYLTAERLWKSVLEVIPDSYRAHLQLGLYYVEAGELRALRDGPTAANDLWESGAAELNRALECTDRPQFLSRLEMFLGYTRTLQEQPAEAARHFQNAVQYDPGNYLAWKDYGDLLARQGDYTGAARKYRRALKLPGAPGDAWAALGAAEFELGHEREALDHVRQAVAAAPQAILPHRNLAWILATAQDPSLRNSAEAVEHADLARRQTRDTDWKVLDVAAAAYAAADRFPDAASTAAKALDLAQVQSPKSVTAISARKRLYDAGQPYRRSGSAARSE